MFLNYTDLTCQMLKVTDKSLKKKTLKLTDLKKHLP